MIIHYIMIGLGGALGAMARVGFSKLLPGAIMGIPFPILCVNIIGCFMIGVLTESMALYWSISDNMRYFLIAGFLGGFTTFSTFALEFGLLFAKNEWFSAMLYAILSVALSIIFFFIGLKIVRGL